MRPGRWALALVLLAFGGCGTDSLVGGKCREGLTECNSTCIDTEEDTSNCGACGNVCASGLACHARMCSDEGSLLRRDAGADSAPDGGEGQDASEEASSNPVDAGGDGLGGDGPGCTPPFNTVEHCGDCSTVCAIPTPVCGLQGTYKCLAQCEAPLEPCGGACIDLFSDELNCGACNHVCPSGICQAGQCVGRGFGHEIVIGMDYTDSTLSSSSAQVVLLASSALLTDRGAVRVIAYDEYADPSSAARINAWLSAAATSKGRTVTFTSAGKFTTIPPQLAVVTYDVFLIYDQPLAPSEQMATTGTLWNGAIDAFAKGGGVVVALDGGSAGRVRDLLTNAGLLSVTGETDVVGTQLHVDAPTDVVGLSLPDVFAAKKSTVSFATSLLPDNHHVFVVKDTMGLPVVVHSVP